MFLVVRQLPRCGYRRGRSGDLWVCHVTLSSEVSGEFCANSTFYFRIGREVPTQRLIEQVAVQGQRLLRSVPCKFWRRRSPTHRQTKQKERRTRMARLPRGSSPGMSSRRIRDSTARRGRRHLACDRDRGVVNVDRNSFVVGSARSWLDSGAENGINFGIILSISDGFAFQAYRSHFINRSTNGYKVALIFRLGCRLI